MPDLKTCPFCLEEIPEKALKCRYCESVVDDIPPSAVPSSKDSKTGDVPKSKREPLPPEDFYYQDTADRKRGKRFLVPMVIVIALLVMLGAGGAFYWFFFAEPGETAADVVDRDFLLGSWKGGSGNNEVYFQFLPNDMVNVAVPPEDYWFRTQYRVVEAEQYSSLELYHGGEEEWERTAELTPGTEETFTMVDTWDNIIIDLERITDSEFRDVINELPFER